MPLAQSKVCHNVFLIFSGADVNKCLLSALFILAFTAAGLSGKALSAQTLQVPVDTYKVHCSYPNGQPVMWFADPSLNDVGYTTQKGIYYNPTVLSSMSDHLHLFWLGHECGHAHLQTTNEDSADCFSAQTGVAQHWFDASDAAELGKEMQNNPGDNSHRPGPQRVAHVIQCMGVASASASGEPPGGGSASTSNGIGPSLPSRRDPTGINHDVDSLCDSLSQMMTASDDGFESIRGDDRTHASSFSTLKLPLALSCHISKLAHTDYTCEFSPAFYDPLVHRTKACFPNAIESDGAEVTSFTIGAHTFSVYKDKEQTILRMNPPKQ